MQDYVPFLKVPTDPTEAGPRILKLLLPLLGFTVAIVCLATGTILCLAVAATVGTGEAGGSTLVAALQGIVLNVCGITTIQAVRHRHDRRALLAVGVAAAVYVAINVLAAT